MVRARGVGWGVKVREWVRGGRVWAGVEALLKCSNVHMLPGQGFVRADPDGVRVRVLKRPAERIHQSRRQLVLTLELALEGLGEALPRDLDHIPRKVLEPKDLWRAVEGLARRSVVRGGGGGGGAGAGFVL